LVVPLCAVPVGAQSPLWVQQSGTAGVDQCFGLAPDGVGGVFAAGFTQGSLGGPSAGGTDAWLARYDPWGARLWIRQIGTSASDVATAVSADGLGGVFVTGWTGGALGGPSNGGSDAWLARYDAVGNQVWITQLGSPQSDTAYAVAADRQGGVYIGGGT